LTQAAAGCALRPDGSSNTKGLVMEIVNRFLSFDKLIGPALVKIVYFLGLAGIALGVIGMMLGGLAALTSNPVAGLGSLLGAPIFGLVFLCFWRFACELYIVLFRAGDDVAAIRAQGSPPASPPAS
jgi:hypothetical protein